MKISPSASETAHGLIKIKISMFNSWTCVFIYIYYIFFIYIYILYIQYIIYIVLYIYVYFILYMYYICIIMYWSKISPTKHDRIGEIIGGRHLLGLRHVDEGHGGWPRHHRSTGAAGALAHGPWRPSRLVSDEIGDLVFDQLVSWGLVLRQVNQISGVCPL